MHPKKIILLMDADEDSLGVLRYLLETHGFAVQGAQSVAEARALKLKRVDCLVTNGPIAYIDGFAEEMERRWPFPSHLRVSKGFKVAEFIDEVRIASATKRGPRVARGAR